MKFLKAFLGVILLIVSVLLLIGVFIPEIDDQFETRIDRPVVQVFAGMANTNGLTEWVEGLDEVKRTSGFLAMPGSTFELYFRSNETADVFTMQILEVVPLESIKFTVYNEKTEIVKTSVSY